MRCFFLLIISNMLVDGATSTLEAADRVLFHDEFEGSLRANWTSLTEKSDNQSWVSGKGYGVDGSGGARASLADQYPTLAAGDFAERNYSVKADIKLTNPGAQFGFIVRRETLEPQKHTGYYCGFLAGGNGRGFFFIQRLREGKLEWNVPKEGQEASWRDDVGELGSWKTFRVEVATTDGATHFRYYFGVRNKETLAFEIKDTSDQQLLRNMGIALRCYTGDGVPSGYIFVDNVEVSTPEQK